MNGSMTTRQIVDFYRKNSPKTKAVEYLAEKNGVSIGTIEDILSKNQIDLTYYFSRKGKVPVVKEEIKEQEKPKTKKKDTEKIVPAKKKELTIQDIKSKAFEAVCVLLDSKVDNEKIDFYIAGINDVIGWMEEFNK